MQIRHPLIDFFVLCTDLAALDSEETWDKGEKLVDVRRIDNFWDGERLNVIDFLTHICISTSG